MSFRIQSRHISRILETFDIWNLSSHIFITLGSNIESFSLMGLDFSIESADHIFDKGVVSIIEPLERMPSIFIHSLGRNRSICFFFISFP
jgi:hypothetical protein